MKVKNHILGFPRIGLNRELKFAQEKYWNGEITKKDLLFVGKMLRKRHWKQQYKNGIDYISVGDFSWYDQVLNISMMLGNIPKRHTQKNIIDLNTLFLVARGCAPFRKPTFASEMTKWFNTNYHYIVPEFTKNQIFKYSWNQLLDEVDESLSLGYNIKPILLGPLTYLWLGKVKGENFNRITLLKRILPIYQYVLNELKKRNINWVQIDEPILSFDLPEIWKNSFVYAYNELNNYTNIMLTTYFGKVDHNLEIIKKLPIQGIHFDLISGKYNLSNLINFFSKDILFSFGVINGRNIWSSDLFKWFNILKPILKKRYFWIGPSCSFLHIPIDLSEENLLENDIKNWFSFAIQKCKELKLLSDSLNKNNVKKIEKYSKKIISHNISDKVHKIDVENRLKNLKKKDFKRKNIYKIRKKIQKNKFNFPLLPTTTIGSFPQTNKIRKLRLDYKTGKINSKYYNKKISKYIKKVIKIQEKLGVDVLVHGEPERNDMVEYFGENMNGFIFTKNGWVQSYGSRCVKPPIIIGDVYRKKPITIKWSKFSQSLTKKPIKGMLTGPVTILCWSFLREDIKKSIISKQIALALRDEVSDLEKSGIKIIQIDEPALREGLPLRKKNWDKYLSWSVDSFRLMSSGVKDSTQIHTHMCYCEFNDIMKSISDLDADVITIETSRSEMDLLEYFKEFNYPNDIGPGVYDIHSPNIPTIQFIESLIKKAINYISVKKLWINPDCGLKTRTFEESILGIKNMIQATKNFRKIL
ncbi:5-methyltetrahydropteroyltriglutamate--homocysteine S-methyltransferase [Buchnera aphidicola]|uniref:5-methyltetrahydropteroyltriglutamate-- homocysteine S-methyltransferase n=1 Tax=Buchnera aphidicola TaxID=9 RepID=UPI0031B83D08